MKIQPLRLIMGFAMLFALTAFASPLSANYAPGNDNGSLPNTPTALQVTEGVSSAHSPAIVLDAGKLKTMNFNPLTPHPLALGIPNLVVNTRIAIRLSSTDFFFTAMNGGGGSTDSIHTDRPVSQGVDIWEVFLIEPQGGNIYAIKTASGNYLTAVNGGGMGSDAIHSDATSVGAWEKFALVQQIGGYYALGTPNGTNFVTAVDGGGRNTDPLHTNATSVGAWEKFWLVLAFPL